MINNHLLSKSAFQRLLLTTALFLFFPQTVSAEQLEPLEQSTVTAPKEISATEVTNAQSANILDSALLVAALQKGVIAGANIQDPEAIYNFYKSQGFIFFWTEDAKPSARAEKSLEVLSNAAHQGMNPVNYNVDALKSMIVDDKIADPVSFEALMSDSVALYMHDLTGMRVTAKSIGEDSKSWSRGMKTEDALRYLSQNTNAEKALQDLLPVGKLYPILQQELDALMKDMQEHPDSNLKPIAFPGLIYPHKNNSVVSVIRKRFLLETKKDQVPEFYDDALVDRIKSFQKANGLKADGIIGQRTIDAINLGRTDKLVKILANMERLRWIKEKFPDRYLLVNIPAMALWAFEGDKISFEMPVIVGKPDWPTMSFKTDIVGIRFNPSWYVPPAIKTKDLLPELQKDPNYLKKKNLELLYYTSDGAKSISAHDVDWSTMTEEGLKSFAMIQNPGNENPLGKIRVLMPNQYNIYLHDTNSPELFTKDYRALSHGCIRLGEPKRVANFVLGSKPDWNEERLNAILAKKNTIEVSAEGTVPVYIMYQTIWQDAAGDLIFGQDIYGNDRKLVDELSKRKKLPVEIKPLPVAPVQQLSKSL